MPTQISGRVTLILAVLFFSLWMIFPTGNPFKPDLKPGIDMVGGTSLLYEIKVPAGMADSTLSEQVMNSLKKRVDPQGVRNLIWRPQGGTRLEIQMPITEKSKETKALREKFAKAQRDLEETNVRLGEVSYAVQELKGEARVAKLQSLGQGSTARAEILGALASTWDQLRAAAERQDAGEEARLQIQYDALLERLNDTNLAVVDLQNKLDLSKAEDRAKGVDELKKRFADFPRRLAAIDQFQTEYAAFSQVKDSIDDAAELKRLLKGSGVIEFHILAESPDVPFQQYQEMVDRLLKRGPRVQAGDPYRWYEVDRSAEVTRQVDQAIVELQTKPDAATQQQIINRVSQGNESVKSLMASLISNLNDAQTRATLRNQIIDTQLIGGHNLIEYNEKRWALCWTTADKAMVQREGQPRWALERAYPDRQSGSRQVGFQFDQQGAKLFGDLTGNNLHKPLAIILDDKLISAPNINSQINGSGVITGGGRGGFPESELNYMVNTLNAGALPAQLAEEPISEQQVGPQLGADNLRAGLSSCLLGLLVVAVFMIVYYHISGVVAIIALAMNMIMILGVMAALNATWTLPAVAGIVLTIGMSVDANVLVFERLREEQQRGLSLKLALRNAYDRAASAIIDSNAVTAITCLILYYFGSEEVKGFGLTLMIGLVSSLFTALFVTKTIFAAMLNNFNLQRLGCLPVSWPALGRALHPNVKWVGLAKYFVAASLVMIVLGTASLIATYRKGNLFDIEFSSGTAVEFKLKQATPIDEIRKAVTDRQFESQLPSPTVVAVGTDDMRYEIVTPSNDSKAVTAAVLDSLSGRLDLVEPSSFAAMDEDFDGALNKAIFPITAETRTIGGRTPNTLRSHIGGVAVLLKDLSPKLKQEDIEARLEQVRLQPQTGNAGTSQYRQIDVQVFEDTGDAIILTSDPNASWDAVDAIKQEQWTAELAKPTWSAVQLAIHNPAKLQRITNFNPQVAGEMQRDALVALVLSLIVVMAYIWLRFGNLKYGTATVAAMLHDTILVVGFVGMSHYLGQLTFFREFLLIEPFRVNLTLVAAVLTVMSYSMVDTIVVFDRIRENRGKFGHLDATVINDSVNQTLSRTLLTVFTTTMSVFVMYVIGGPGIHGFTFVMLIGILIGTYSSFAIAAPILLIGENKTQATSGGRGTPSGRRQQLQGA